MPLTIDLTEEEETRLRQLAEIRGVKPEEHAHLLLTNLLVSMPVQGDELRTDRAETERLMEAAKAGDREARRKLLYMTPPVATFDPVTGEPRRPISDEALRRENIYEDRF